MTSKIKVLNLDSGLGGNAALWPRDRFEVTSVEIRDDLCQFYQDRFPDDTVICGDAHQYLLENYAEYDFIWTSPECPTHGQYRYRVGVLGKGFDAVYPDMQLYQRIILLHHHHKGKYCVENTISYYEPLIEPQKIHRHYFWANFNIAPISLSADGIGSRNTISAMEELRGIDLSGYEIADKRKCLRNCTNSELGLHVLKCAYPDIFAIEAETRIELVSTMPQDQKLEQVKVSGFREIRQTTLF